MYSPQIAPFYAVFPPPYYNARPAVFPDVVIERDLNDGIPAPHTDWFCLLRAEGGEKIKQAREDIGFKLIQWECSDARLYPDEYFMFSVREAVGEGLFGAGGEGHENRGISFFSTVPIAQSRICLPVSGSTQFRNIFNLSFPLYLDKS